MATFEESRVLGATRPAMLIVSRIPRQVAQRIVRDDRYDMVVLDEIPRAVTAGLLPMDALIGIVRSKYLSCT
jgi:hypothetical protein